MCGARTVEARGEHSTQSRRFASMVLGRTTLRCTCRCVSKVPVVLTVAEVRKVLDAAQNATLLRTAARSLNCWWHGVPRRRLNHRRVAADHGEHRACDAMKGAEAVRGMWPPVCLTSRPRSRPL
jgi:hypothetical protein